MQTKFCEPFPPLPKRFGVSFLDKIPTPGNLMPVVWRFRSTKTSAPFRRVFGTSVKNCEMTWERGCPLTAISALGLTTESCSSIATSPQLWDRPEPTGRWDGHCLQMRSSEVSLGPHNSLSPCCGAERLASSNHFSVIPPLSSPHTPALCLPDEGSSAPGRLVPSTAFAKRPGVHPSTGRWELRPKCCPVSIRNAERCPATCNRLQSHRRCLATRFAMRQRRMSPTSSPFIAITCAIPW